MIEQDKEQFKAVMKKLSIVYKEKVSKEFIDIYWEVLTDISIEEVTEMANKHIRTNRFFPKPCELIKQYEYIDTDIKEI